MVGRRVCIALALAMTIAVGVTPVGAQGSVTRITPGERSRGDASQHPVVSANGRYVAFDSTAENLVADDANGMGDVFVYDRDDGSLDLVSTSTDGTQGDQPSYVGGISNDGLVAFSSFADNLTPGDDNSGTRDAFIHDLAAGTTVRIGSAPVLEGSWGGHMAVGISADGARLIYQAWVLIGEYAQSTELRVHNLVTGNSHVAVTAAEAPEYPTLSSNGQYIAFHTQAQLAVADSDQTSDVYLHEVSTGERTLASGAVGVDWGAGSPSISGNGRYTAFETYEWVEWWEELPLEEVGQVLVFDRTTGDTTLVSKSTDGVAGNGRSGSAAISHDGQHVSFASSSTNLLTDDTNAQADVFVRNRTAGETIRVSPAGSGDHGVLSGGASVLGPQGGFVVFESREEIWTQDYSWWAVDLLLRML